jgi:hypothetical protein
MLLLVAKKCNKSLQSYARRQRRAGIAPIWQKSGNFGENNEIYPLTGAGGYTIIVTKKPNKGLSRVVEGTAL